MVNDIPPDDPRRPVVVLITHPTDGAEALAAKLVADRLAACVNLLPPMRSVYRWQGEVTADDEQLLVLKTTQDRLEAVAGLLAVEHPYDVPELLAIPVLAGSGPYLAWLTVNSSAIDGPAPGP